jgi:hypothetical protein
MSILHQDSCCFGASSQYRTHAMWCATQVIQHDLATSPELVAASVR